MNQEVTKNRFYISKECIFLIINLIIDLLKLKFKVGTVYYGSLNKACIIIFFIFLVFLNLLLMFLWSRRNKSFVPVIATWLKFLRISKVRKLSHDQEKTRKK